MSRAGLLALLVVVSAACRPAADRGSTAAAGAVRGDALVPELSDEVWVVPEVDPGSNSIGAPTRLVPVGDRVLYALGSWDTLLVGFAGADGTPEGPPHELRSAAYEWLRFAVASDGTHHLIAWFGWSDGRPPDRIHVRFLDGDGAPLPPEWTVAFPREALRDPTLTASGSVFLATWRFDRVPDFEGPRVGVRIGPDGPLDAAPFEILANDSGALLGQAAASDGEQWVVAWEDPPAKRGLFATRVSLAGEVQDPEGIPLVEGHRPRLRFDGSGYVLSYLDASGGPVGLARLDRSLAVLEQVGATPSLHDAPGFGTHVWAPTAVPTNGRYLVLDDGYVSPSALWAQWRDVELRPVVDPFPVVSNEGRRWIYTYDAAAVGNGVLVAYVEQDRPGSGWADLAVRVGPEGDVSSPVALAEVGSCQASPVVVSDGVGFAIVWREDLFAGASYRVARVLARERLQPGSPLDVLSWDPRGWPPTAWRVEATAAARDIVVAPQECGMLPARLGPSDLVPPVDDQGDYLRACEVAVAGDSTGNVLVHESPGHLMLVRPDGTIATRSELPVVTGRWAFGPAAVTVPDGFAIAWSDAAADDRSTADLWLARVSPEGQLAGAAPSVLADAAGEQSDVRLAGRDGTLLAAWTDLGTDAEGDVRGALLVPAAGAFEAYPLDIAVGPGVQKSASVCSVADGFLVAWTDGGADGSPRVLAATVPAAPGTEASAPFLVSPEGAPARRPSVAADERGTVVAAYERFDSTPGVLTWRVSARVVARPRLPDGSACDDRLECASHNCADGVCCNQPCGGGSADCLACSVAAGATEDGRCAAVTDGTACGDDGDGGGCASAEACIGGLCMCGAGAGVGGAGAGGDAREGAGAGGCGCGVVPDGFAALWVAAVLGVLRRRPARAQGARRS